MNEFVYYLIAQVICFHELSCDFLMSPNCVKEIILNIIQQMSCLSFLPPAHSKLLDVFYDKHNITLSIFS